jgi:hypothetical protein
MRPRRRKRKKRLKRRLKKKQLRMKSPNMMMMEIKSKRKSHLPWLLKKTKVFATHLTWTT